MYSITFQLTSILVLGIGAQWLAWKLRLPSIILLLVAGFMAGPVFHWVDTDLLLGELLFPVVSLAVGLILFEGGLSLKLVELRKVGGVVVRLVTLGALVTWIVGTVAACWLFKLDLSLAALIGAIFVVTGPTVITPLLRHIRPSGTTGPILKWEGIVIDPIGAMLAVLVYEVIITGASEKAWALVVLSIAKTLVIGGGLGVLAALLLAQVLHRFWAPDYLQAALSLVLALISFATANALQHEAGLLAVTVMGVVLANQRWADVEHIVEFKENLRVLLLSVLFIVLGARLNPIELQAVLVPGALFLAVLVFIARPLSVLISTGGTKLAIRERLFLAAVAPRGIVAAAVASVFALRLSDGGWAQSERLVPITFLVIIGTVTLYGLAAPAVARRLRIAVANPQGILFVGAYPWSRAVAKAVVGLGVRVLLVDTNRSNILAARMAGLPAFAGSILSDSALDEIDFGGLGRLIAATPNESVNVLAVRRFVRVFGRSGCFQLATQRQRAEPDAGRADHARHHARTLLGGAVTFAMIADRLESGETVKVTRLTDEFGWEAYRGRYGEHSLPLFVLTETGALQVVTTQTVSALKSGQTIVGLVRETPDANRTAPSPRTGGHSPSHP